MRPTPFSVYSTFLLQTNNQSQRKYQTRFIWGRNQVDWPPHDESLFAELKNLWHLTLCHINVSNTEARSILLISYTPSHDTYKYRVCLKKSTFPNFQVLDHYWFWKVLFLRYPVYIILKRPLSNPQFVKLEKGIVVSSSENEQWFSRRKVTQHCCCQVTLSCCFVLIPPEEFFSPPEVLVQSEGDTRSQVVHIGI